MRAAYLYLFLDSGILYSWGCGESGQLAQGDDYLPFLAIPKIVQPIVGTVVGQVACGEHHTAVLTGLTDGSVRSVPRENVFVLFFLILFLPICFGRPPPYYYCQRRVPIVLLVCFFLMLISNYACVVVSAL
jgi:hypothetical protein